MINFDLGLLNSETIATMQVVWHVRAVATLHSTVAAVPLCPGRLPSLWTRRGLDNTPRKLLVVENRLRSPLGGALHQKRTNQSQSLP